MLPCITYGLQIWSSLTTTTLDSRGIRSHVNHRNRWFYIISSQISPPLWLHFPQKIHLQFVSDPARFGEDLTWCMFFLLKLWCSICCLPLAGLLFCIFLGLNHVPEYLLLDSWSVSGKESFLVLWISEWTRNVGGELWRLPTDHVESLTFAMASQIYILERRGKLLPSSGILQGMWLMFDCALHSPKEAVSCSFDLRVFRQLLESLFMCTYQNGFKFLVKIRL